MRPHLHLRLLLLFLLQHSLTHNLCLSSLLKTQNSHTDTSRDTTHCAHAFDTAGAQYLCQRGLMPACMPMPTCMPMRRCACMHIHNTHTRCPCASHSPSPPLLTHPSTPPLPTAPVWLLASLASHLLRSLSLAPPAARCSPRSPTVTGRARLLGRFACFALLASLSSPAARSARLQHSPRPFDSSRTPA